MQTRLQKILSTAGIASRRAAETLIVEGRVTVNGKPMTELGSKADPDTDDIRVDGRRVKAPGRRRYILLYKPRGYITSRMDPEQRPTVNDLLPRAACANTSTRSAGWTTNRKGCCCSRATASSPRS